MGSDLTITISSLARELATQVQDQRELVEHESGADAEEHAADASEGVREVEQQSNEEKHDPDTL